MPLRPSDPSGTAGAPTVVVGNHTPADTYANPTDAIDDFALGAVFNGTTWDRVRSAGALGSVSVGGNAASASTDSGNPVKIGGRADTTQPTSVTDGQRVDAFFDEAGRLIVRSKSRTGTVTSQADQATNVTLLALNELRLGASIVNESSSILYVKCGATASATSYTVALGPMGTVGSYWECPFGYTGIIDGIWSLDSTGSARITEWT